MATSSLKVVKTARFSVLGLLSETDVEVPAEKKQNKAGKETLLLSSYFLLLEVVDRAVLSIYFSVGNVLSLTIVLQKK